MVKLVDDWHKAWKWLSVELALIAGVAMELYENLPQFKDYISDSTFHHIMSGCVILIIVARLLKQGSDDVPPR